MPRGGKRPGAGAKPGNLNALKHGKNSRRLAEAHRVLPMIPEFRFLMRIAEQRLGAPRSERERAARIMARHPAERARAVIERLHPHLAREFNVVPDEVHAELQRGRQLYFALRRLRAALAAHHELNASIEPGPEP